MGSQKILNPSRIITDYWQQLTNQQISKLSSENSPMKMLEGSAIRCEHLNNPEEIFRKTSILLKDDGIVVIATPDTDAFTCKNMKAKWTHHKYEHVLYSNRNTLKQLAMQTGFEVVEHRICYKAINLFYLFFQFRTYKHWILTPLSRIFYDTLPRNLLSHNFYVSMGESVFILQKRKKI